MIKLKQIAKTFLKLYWNNFKIIFCRKKMKKEENDLSSEKTSTKDENDLVYEITNTLELCTQDQHNLQQQKVKNCFFIFTHLI